MKAYFTNLYEYNLWANQALLKTIAANPVSDKIKALYSHNVGAHHIWNARMMNHPFRLKIFDILDLTELKKEDELNFKHSLNLVVNQDFNQLLTYQNIKGQTFQNTIQDIHIHLINHSTYHRGQINQLLRTEGFEPVPVDYILYAREKF